MPMDIGVNAQQMEVVADDARAAPVHVPDFVMGDSRLDQIGEGFSLRETVERDPKPIRIGSGEIAG